MKPLITIVIPTRNRSALLARLLDSLAALRYPSWEAMVVDDGSTDDTAGVVECYRGRGLPLTYLYQPWQMIGAARNLALRHADGTIAAFTDDDCVVDPDWLDALAHAFENHPEALGIQGKTVTDHSAMTPFTRQVEQLEGGQPYRTCNIAYRTDVLRELGGFDTALIRGEDVVMGKRVLERGPIDFAPDALVLHPPRPKEWANRAAWKMLLESELHFRRTYPGYARERSQTLSLQKPEHVFSRWVILPVRTYWRWHYAYFRRHKAQYLRHVPLIVAEKLALFTLLPYFVARWRARPSSPSSLSSAARPGRAGTNPGLLPLVSVVIPTRNRSHLLPHLLVALENQDYACYEVIVVDDASTDATPEILRAWEAEGRIYLRLEMPGGSYAARNLGWRAARGHIVAFTDDDCLPNAGWLSGLARAMENPAISGAQGITLAGPGEITPFTHQIEQRRPGAPYRTCNIAYRRSVLEAMGGFDGDLRWYADNILGLRVFRSGSRPGFAADAIVRHPPRPKQWRGRSDWLARFRADAVYRRYLLSLGNVSRLAPPQILPFILWIARPLLKQSWRHLAYALRHPVRYVRQAPPMVREKWNLLRAIGAYWRQEAEYGEILPPLGKDPLLSVVIVTRGHPGLLAGTLAALKRQSQAAGEIIVVEHGGEEMARHLAERYGAHWLAAGTLTLGAARQRGVEATSGDVIAFTDDDCLPHPGWLEAITTSWRLHPELWGVQGRTTAEPGSPDSHALRVSRPNHLYQTCNIAYRRDAIDRVGGFDTRFQGWFEDTALGARIRQHGQIGWDPDMVVSHRAVRRHLRDRNQWTGVLADEQRLAREYPEFYHRTRGPSFLLAVVARWLIGSPLKTLLRALPSLPVAPRGYARLASSLLHERWELLVALTIHSRT